MPLTTLKTNIKEFTNIIQVADIQIRLTTRHDEYREVFTRLCDDVSKTPETTAVCVVGDIVHSKLDLSPECVQVTKEFLVGLANLRPTILVAGNHDTNLTNRHRLDSLSPIVEAINHPQLYYLRESGLFGLGDILFNNYGVFDDTDKYLKGEDIPKVHRNDFKHVVCLFHGTVDGALSEMGFKLVNKSVTVGMFDHHDIVLLGDIHQAQDLQDYDYLTNRPAIRYCGSLIQQNHGEELKGHGYSYWDLETRTYNQVPILNDYGYFTVLLDKGVINTDLTQIPKKARLRFQCFETVPTEVKAALASIRSLSDLTEISYMRVETPEDDTKKTTVGNVKIHDLTNNDYQVNLVTNYLTTTLGITDQTLIDTIIKVHNDITSGIDSKSLANNRRWKPIRFDWENLFSYGEDNFIDFTKLKDVVGIFAANASGKSAIFSALSFCIFDKCDREFKASNILNDQKMNFKAKFEFEIDGVHYFIERIGNADKKGAVKVNVKFWKSENGNNVDLHGTERSDTNDIIRGYVGTYEDFVLTSLSVQSGKNISSFIDMGNTERKDLLAQFLGLNVFDALHEKSNKRLNELSGILKRYKSEDHTQKLLDNTNTLSQCVSQINEENISVTDLTTKRDLANQKITEETQKLIKLEENIPSLTDSLNKKLAAESRIPLLQKELETSVDGIATMAQELIDVEKIIKELEDKNIVELHHKRNELNVKQTQTIGQMEKLTLKVNHEESIVNRLKGHQYDPNCKFCVSNSGTIITDADKATSNIGVFKETGAKLELELESVRKQLKELEWTVEGVATYATSVSKRSNIQSLQLRTTNRLTVAKDTLAKLDESIKESEKNIELYNKNKESLEANEKTSGRIIEMKKFLSNIEQMLKDKNKVIMDLNAKKAVCQTQIDIINKKVEEIKLIEVECKAYEIYVQAVSRDGIPYVVITSAVPQIESEVNNILSQIVEFQAKFEVDGKNVVPYIVYDNRKWLMSLTSGFEKFTLGLAIRVALSNISNLPRSNFLVLDEGFGVLDAEHLTSMYTLFGYLKSQFEFVMVISHLEALRDMVDKHIEIKKDNGFSKVNF
jgi:DNA repair exonuclease SbcCD ATPase subunit